MKYYTNLEDFEKRVEYLKIYNPYRIPHMSFFLCLLPKKYKDEFMRLSLPEKRSIFESIYDVKDEFCDRIEDADFYVAPFIDIHDDPKEHVKRYKDEINYAFKLGKKLLYFLGTDNNDSVKISKDRGIVFRTSGFLSEAGSNVYGCPTINYDAGKPKDYKTKLSISFTGCKYTSDTGRAGHKFNKIREHVIDDLLLKIPNKCDFIFRDGWGYAETEEKIEFLQNIRRNLYGLCVRGGGNFSFRLGETLMMGRIPILIDTECILPFVDEIPWDANCIRIKPENFHRIPEVIQEYHDSHTEDELIAIQKQNRILWEEYFIPKNTYKRISSLINNFNRL